MYIYNTNNRKIEIEKSLKAELQNQFRFIQHCYQVEPLKFNQDTDFSNHGVLQDTALSHSPFIGHSK